MFTLTMVESERGWGQEYWTVEFYTLEGAKAYQKEVNDKNTAAAAPDWYIAALEIRDETGKTVG